MKRIIQLTLFLFLLLISAIFYQIYFGGEKEVIPQSVNNDEKISIQGENNLIENLKYEVRLKQGHQYIITSDLSEISYQENQEIVKMYKVIAIFIDDTNIPITITSDEAIYNNSNYNTRARGSTTGNGNRHIGCTIGAMFDVTNTTNDKVKFFKSTNSASCVMYGNTNYMMTGLNFWRLGDT